jgi:phosphoenolpyruvate synthase/pyruvate phosphate dikinase
MRNVGAVAGRVTPRRRWETMSVGTQRTLWLDDVGPPDALRVGQKAANLAIANPLARVPRAFCVLTDLFEDHLRRSGGAEVIESRLVPTAPLDSQDELLEISEQITQRIRETGLGERDCAEIAERREELGGEYVAVRSSGVAEDLPDSSFAGQYRSHLGVRHPADVVEALKDCLASLYSPHAIAYRRRRGVREGSLPFGAIVQRMVDASVAGVLSTVHPVTGDPEEVVIESAWGLGSVVVGGEVTPDHFVVARADLSVARRVVNPKRVAHYLGGRAHREEVPRARREQSSLDDEQVVDLARMGIAVERHVGSPQDLEWAIDRSGACWLLQTRPVTGLGRPAVRESRVLAR